MTTLTLTSGQISPIIEIGKGTRVTSSGNGTIEFYPGALADAKNGGKFQVWPKGIASGSVDAIRGMCIRATATGVMTVTLEEGKNDAEPNDRYWDENYATVGAELTYIPLGDSKTANGVAWGATGFRLYNRGYWGRAINLSGVPFKLKSMAAQGGWKVADMLTALESRISTYGAPGYVLFYGGVNDLYVTAGTATSVEDYKATVAAIYALCNAHGIKLVRVGLPPEGTSAGGYYTKTLIATIKRLNEWDAALCASYGFKFVDPWRADIHGQPTDAAGNAIAANYWDTLVHESHTGAYLLAKAVAAELVSLTGVENPRNHLANTNIDSVVAAKKTITSITGDGTTATATLADHQFEVGDDAVVWSSSNTAENVKDYYGVKRVTSRTQNTFSYACTATAATVGTLYASTGRNHCENSMQTGTAGTKTVVTGNVADGFTVSATVGMTVAATKESHTKWSALPGSTDAADADGLGEWQRFAVTSAAANDLLIYSYLVPDPLAIRGGENYVIECEVEVYGTIANLRAISLAHFVNFTATGSSPTTLDLRDGWDGTNNENDSTEARKFILRTPDYNAYIKSVIGATSDTLLPAGTFGFNNATNPEMKLYAEFSGVGGCDIRVGLPRIVRVD